MATNEVNGLLTVKDKDGNLYIVYPVTKLENISDLEIASASLDGLMSKADKAKLDGVAAGAQKNTVTGVKGNAESAYRKGNVNLTPTNIGLGNVNNTSDVSKPLSNAAKTEFLKINNELIDIGNSMGGHFNNKNNPHGITKAQIGLGNVDNTSDANKPVSTATQTALNSKANASDLAKYLPLTGGAMTGQIANNSGGSTWINGRNKALIAVKSTPSESFMPAVSMKTNNGSWQIGSYSNEELYFSYTSDENVKNGNNVAIQFIINPNTKTIKGFNIDGNSAAATKLQTARKINGVAFNGTADITLPAATESANGLMSAADKAKLNKINYVFGVDATGPYIEEI